MALIHARNSPTSLSFSPCCFFFFFFFCFILGTRQLEARPPQKPESDRESAAVASPGPSLESIRSTIVVIEDVTNVVSKFAHAFGFDFRLSNAILDCLELLDYSAEELNWTLSSIAHKPSGNNGVDGYTNSDAAVWLGAAFGNQGTCIDGFEGTITNSLVKGVVTSSVNQITTLVQMMLRSLRHTTPAAPRHSSKNAATDRRNLGASTASADPFPPPWIKSSGDRKLLQQAAAGGVNADVTVAADGTGNYTRVADAVLAAPDHSPRRYVIYVKQGVYKENVEIKRTKWNIALIGQGMNSTVISGNRNHVDGWTTFRSATFAVRGKGFMARDISFENTAGPGKQQAVALRSDSDLSVFYRCGVYGYQDTLYAHSLRQFYRECRITGTVDFIFGDAAVVFQNCQILARKGLPNQKNTVTAQGRKDPAEPTGFSLQFCNISADPDLQASIGGNANATAPSTTSYLGRPWKMYSRTVVMQSYIGGAISPKGWLPWNASDFALATLFYGEYRNYGPSAGLNDRVNWTGFRVINDSNVANKFTVAQLIDGNAWLPATGVSFVAGLSD